MMRRTPSQRRWDHVQGYLVGLAIVLAGLALALGPIGLGPIELPRSVPAGALAALVGLLWILRRVLQQRREARELQAGRVRRELAAQERERREREPGGGVADPR